MERKLASVQRVDGVRPIPNADAIECVQILGWDVVAKKNDLRVGDIVVYFEVDSVLPIRPEFEFLRKSCYVKKDWLPNGEGFRLKTIQLRKQISQGLVVPVDILPGNELPTIGDDVTDLLGIIKWDPPVPANLAGQVRGNFPTFIKKTDQERIQSLPKVLDDPLLYEARWEVTTKLDGSSCTIYRHNGELGVCSRNLDLKMDQEGNTFVDVAKRYRHTLPDGLAVQGELMGPGIQDNREKLQHHDFYIFDVWDIAKQRYLGTDERIRVANHMQAKHVPILHRSISFEELDINNVHDFLMMADGASLNNPVREGIVFKKLTGDFSFKVISNLFLLKEQ